MFLKRLLLLLTLVLFVQSCKKSTNEFESDFLLYREYISSFTSGLVSSESDIRIVFNFDKSEWVAGQEIGEDLFDISPSVKGKTVALSSNTLSFVPESKWSQDVEYRITFNLKKVIEVPKDLSEFRFTIKTLKQDFSVFTNDLQSYSKDYQYLNATLQSADILDFETASKLVEATQNGKKLKVKFDKTFSTKTHFRFIVDSIARPEEDGKILISWNGKPFDIDQKGEIEYDITGKNNFKVIGTEVGDQDNQSLFINFSDPIKKGQNLNGLVQVEGVDNLRFSIEGNLLKVFFTESLKGLLNVEVFQGIQSEDGYKMKNNYIEKVLFEQAKPNVRFIKNGTILPSSNNLKVNFEAANLRAVDVRVYKIHSNNVLQFLQDNELNGGRNLRKVAAPISTQTINLLEKKLSNYSKWNAFALDLANIISIEQGAIYRVELSFKKSYSLYKCEESSEDSSQDDYNNYQDNFEVRSADEYDYYDDYWYDDYEWQDRQDACSDSYFRRGSVGTNVLASNLGVITKRGDNGSYFVAVSDIVSTNAVAGATVELYDYQQQKLAVGKTDNEGTIRLEVSKYAYFAVVTKGNEITYVKLDEGMSLSVSNFDVSGKKMQEALKGYIYGERGVWRPGDTLHLAFMLNDNDSKLDKSHPIKFRLNDPQGKLMYEAVRKYNEENHYRFSVPTKTEYPTGNWEAIVSVGGARFYKRLPIETIKPNRLKIKNNFSADKLSANKSVTDNIEVTWLHGAIAKDLKVEVQAKYIAQKTTFKGYDKYVFDNPVYKFETEESNIFTGKTDQNGKVSFSLQPKITSQAPGMLRATFLTKAYENGGDFSTDVATIDYSPYLTYVGLKTPEPNKYGLLETGKSNKFEVVTLNENGKPKSVKGLIAKVYKVSWRWWWDASYDNLSNYVSSSSTQVFKSFILNTDANGKASFQFKVEDNQWGRYLIYITDENGGHSTGQTVLIDWPYWSGKNRNSEASFATMLTLSADKKSYEVGQTAQISFPSSEGGRALISVEDGAKVVQTLWTNTTKGETKISLPVTAEMAPNVFLNITLLQPHASTLNDSPIRLYGIIPIEVLDKNTKLEPQISMPDVLKPEASFTVKISEKSGKAMTYTLAVVDEGLLDLTRFKTPNAWNDFYSRQALGVKTWDIYDDVIGAYGGKINQIFATGGDEDLKGANAQKANRFKPVVMYLGPFTLEKGKTASHKLEMPNYIGSVRTMVVAGDVKTEAYGSSEKATPVRTPLMVLASLPRKISQGEKVTLPVTLFAMEKQVKNVKVQVKTNKGIKVVGSTSQTVSFANPDEKMVYFNLEAGDLTGIGKIEVIATSGNEKSTYQAELDITNPNPITHDYVDLVLEANSTKTLDFSTFGVVGSNKAKIEVSSFPSIDFNRRLDYLIQYPHGCLEQVTSGVFPQLYLNDVVDLSDSRKASISQNIKEGIQKLTTYQVSNGGFSYWNGQDYANDWSTSYVGHFLIEAEKKGYVLPSSFKSKWIAYQQRAAKDWRFNESYRNDIAQAYRLYTLALVGSPDMGSMNRLRETANISNEAKLRLAAAYAIAGHKQAAQTMLNSASLDNINSYYYYGSPERNRAMALETLLLLNDNSRAFAMANDLAKALSSDNWMSTQTTAYALYAMSKFAVKNGGKGIDIIYSQNGSSTKISSQKAFVDRELQASQRENSITLKNNKDNTVYVRVTISGILPVGEEKVIQNKLFGTISYQNRNGQILNVTNINQGTELVAQITIRNTTNQKIENVALTQIVPSGFEIINTRFTDFGDFAENKADYIDIRDDRTNFYFTLNVNETKTFKVLLNASYLGKYYLPGMQAEAMYDNTYVVRTKGQWIEIVE